MLDGGQDASHKLLLDSITVIDCGKADFVVFLGGGDV